MVRFALFVAFVACADDPATSRNKKPPASSDTPTGPARATGVDISKVAFYQGVESILIENREVPQVPQVPLIAGRETTLRVFVAPHEDFVEREIEAALTITTGGEETVLVDTKTPKKPSAQEKIGSTLNFELSPDTFAPSSTFRVELFETTTDPGPGSEGVSAWDPVASGQEVRIDTSDVLEIFVVPVAYWADGSGRLPDTSDAALQAWRDLVYAMFPATDVVVSVGPTIDYDGTLSPNGADWFPLLTQLNQLRNQADVPANSYFYGVFAPDDSFSSWCGAVCTTGLSLLAPNPTNPYYRASIGVGFGDDTSIETLPHELGHAHGREHAPCGIPGDDVDGDYPHAEALIGAWGFDLLAGELLDPATTRDVMSYCRPIWVSDYTYFKLAKQIQSVARGNRGGATPWTLLSVDDGGDVSVGGTVAMVDPWVDAEPVTVVIGDEEVPGWFVPLSHVDGGAVWIEERAPGGWSASIPTLQDRFR